MEKQKILRKGEIRGFFFCLFLIWIILGTILLVKVVPDLATQFILKDNKAFAEDYGNPYSTAEEDKAFLKLKEFNNSLIESEDWITSFFFNQNKSEKIALLIAAITPYFLIILMKIISSEMKSAKKQAKIKRRINNSLKAVR